MMDPDGPLSLWLFVPEVWFILAIVLIVADVVVGMNFFVLSVGMASLIVSGLLWLQQIGAFGDLEFFGSWRQIVLWFAALSLASIALIKLAFQKRGRNGPDINEY